MKILPPPRRTAVEIPIRTIVGRFSPHGTVLVSSNLLPLDSPPSDVVGGCNSAAPAWFWVKPKTENGHRTPFRGNTFHPAFLWTGPFGSFQIKFHWTPHFPLWCQGGIARPVQNSFAKLGAETGITLTVSVADSTETSQAKAGPRCGRSAGPAPPRKTCDPSDGTFENRAGPSSHRSHRT